METFYDGYIVNTIIDASYKAAESKKWEPVAVLMTGAVECSERREQLGLKNYDEEHFLIKEEKMPDGQLKVILKDKQTGKISQIIQ